MKKKNEFLLNKRITHLSPFLVTATLPNRILMLYTYNMFFFLNFFVFYYQSRPQTSVHEGCATLNGGLGRHSSSGSSHSDASPETDNVSTYTGIFFFSRFSTKLFTRVVRRQRKYSA